MNPSAAPFAPPTSQKELQSHVAMILVNLPFPPLPIVARRGDDDNVASGHDLLSQAIACNLIRPEKKGVLDAQAIQERKMHILQTLHGEVSESYTTESAYAAYGRAFRAYMALYPGSPDLRIWPMERVDRTGAIMDQGKQHLAAHAVLVTSNNEIAAVKPQCETYRELIEAYAASLNEQKGGE